MAEAKIFDIVVTQPAVVTAEIDDTHTVIPSTATVGEEINMTLAAVNTGNTAGDLRIKLVISPNTSEEATINTWVAYNIQPGSYGAIPVSGIVINQPGTVEFGVKVWGETESEPSWGTAGKTIIGKILNR